MGKIFVMKYFEKAGLLKITGRKALSVNVCVDREVDSFLCVNAIQKISPVVFLKII